MACEEDAAWSRVDAMIATRKPARSHPHIDRHELAVAIRSATGIEALIWLRDIAGQGPEQAARTVRRTAQALLDAALRQRTPEAS